MEVANLVDAGPLIGWLNASDQWHAWSVKTLSAVRGPLHTTEIVLGEECWHLGGNTQPVHALLGLVRVGAIQLLHPWPGDLATDGAGTTIAFTIQANTPGPGTTTVTATVTGTPCDRLFLRAKVTKN